MRGGPVRALLRLVIYVLLACLLTLVGTVAYASQSATPLPAAAVSRQPGQLARPLPSATPAPPVTTVLATSAFDQLRGDLETIAARSGARVRISLQELSGPRRNTLSLNGNQSFYAASAYKVPLLMAEAQQIASGQAKGSDVLCFDPNDGEDGWFDDYEPGSCFTRDELARRTGRYSDNTAAHILVRYLGGPDVLNGYAKSIGMTASALWVPNTTTTDDLTAAWVNEALGRLGGAAAQAWLFPLLTHTANEHGIPAGLPAGATVVHKIGTMNGTENDSAYIVSGRTSYVLSVAVDGIDESLGWSLIAQISGRIWQYESSRPDFVAPVVATPVAPSALRPNHH
jgi:beta-lactamase class A